MRIFLRRYPAGIDRRFDDVRGATDELIRLARSGHVFGALESTNHQSADDPRHYQKFYHQPRG